MTSYFNQYERAVLCEALDLYTAGKESNKELAADIRRKLLNLDTLFLEPCPSCSDKVVQFAFNEFGLIWHTLKDFYDDPPHPNFSKKIWKEMWDPIFAKLEQIGCEWNGIVSRNLTAEEKSHANL